MAGITLIQFGELGGSFNLIKFNYIISIILSKGSIDSNSSYSSNNNSTLFITLLVISALFNSSINSTCTFDSPSNLQRFDIELERLIRSRFLFGNEFNYIFRYSSNFNYR